MALLYIDRHLVHEVTSPQAFEGLRLMGRKVRRPDLTLATVDHNIPTERGRSVKASAIANEDSRIQVETLEHNTKEFGLEYWGMNNRKQGIVHIIGPEQGFTQPGNTIVCGDSHTATHGAFGALAFGIGTSEVEHVLATQTIVQTPAKNMQIEVQGTLPTGLTSKDLALHIIGRIGTAGGTGHVIEYTGAAIRALSMEARMTICNMSIEGGARAGLIAPDETTFKYLKGRPLVPKGSDWDAAVKYWKTLASDPGAKFDTSLKFDISHVHPQITWGTSPEDVVAITGRAPDPAGVAGDPATQATRQEAMARALTYMGLEAGQKMDEVPVDKVFIGSCTNGRIEDIRAVAEVAQGRKVAPGVHALVVPGSRPVLEQAQEEGLDRLLMAAGFDWREPGCSMCLAMNQDRLEPGQRCASTSNRNFEGRQGRGGRTHLMSPGMAAAAAIKGRLADVREFTVGGVGVQTRAFHTTRPARMQAFTRLEDAVAAPLPMNNMDTDMIIPKQFLKTVKRTGLGKHVFDELRFHPDGSENADFVLNHPKYRASSMLVTGRNFGCGSSREHAPWALLDFGIRCIISESFADIFYSNCFKNGILPVRLSADQVAILQKDAESGKTVSVNLETCRVVRSNGEQLAFVIDAFRRHSLLHGLDEIGQTMQHEAKIAAFENNRKKMTPWM